MTYTILPHALKRIKQRAGMSHMTDDAIINWANQMLERAEDVAREGTRITKANRIHTFVVDVVEQTIVTYYETEKYKELEESKYHIKYKDTLRRIRETELKKLLRTERELLINYHQKMINSLKVFNPNTLAIIEEDLEKIQSEIEKVEKERHSLLLLDKLYNL